MRRHAFDPVSFTFGVLFLAVAAAGLTGPWALRDLDLAWLGPAALVLLGVVVLLTAQSPRGAPRPHPDPDPGPGPDSGPDPVAAGDEPAGEDDEPVDPEEPR